MCDCIDETVMDITTPRNAFLSAFYKRSFAYYTVKERLPKILTQAVDLLARNKDKVVEEYGLGAKEELKSVIGEISKLKYELQTNKPMRNIMGTAPDADHYNLCIAKQSNITYFTSVWLFAECYMYRRIKEIFELTQHLQAYDLFRILKQESFTNSYTAVVELGKYLVTRFNETINENDIKDEFIKLLKLILWGNKCDLSFSAGVVESSSDPFLLLTELESNIVKDQSEEIWLAVSDSNSTSQFIDIVLDNAGYELFTDLCLADFLVTSKLAQKIRFYVKGMPWFVSDVTKFDFDWTIQEMKKSDVPELKTLGDRWSKHLKEKNWIVVDHKFFTMPIDYSYMPKEGSDLYKQLAEAKLVIFKGDLNYRKLFGEKNWEPSTPIDVGLQGFVPSKLAIVRTIKCQLVCGLDSGVAETIAQKSPDWEVTGMYGLIQFCDKIKTY
ncbi:hypothetical protein RN001_015357 [Aquatica leii]|uniref:Sugar phosphate phosphatase n=1 Tax=Aquatica leii TaxID=1421715 RepID=A0AAN7SL46_9COLE|nr:hypothetical protein RN001_015357 [Aquatica leii]